MLLCAAATGCATSGSRPASGASAGALPENRAFAGGTQVRGGFTDQPSAVLDSVVAAPPPVVWATLPAVFETLEVETPTVERASYTIGNRGARVARVAGTRQLSRYLACGTGIQGPNADTYEVTLQLLVRLAASGDGTVVRTTLDAYARPRDAAGEALHCASLGTLEREILALIAEGLAADRTPGVNGEAFAPVVPLSAGRVPVPGDLLRVECLAPGADSALVGQGRYVGAGDGVLRLGMDTRGRTAAVPARHVVRVQVRERRSRAVAGGLVGLVLGAAAAGTYAHRSYDPDAGYHLRQETVTGIGVVVGAFAGGLLGRMVGAMIRSDTWHEAPTEWAIRSSGAEPASTVSSTAAPCPSFERD